MLWRLGRAEPQEGEAGHRWVLHEALNVLNREDVIHAEKEKQAVVDAEKAKQP